MAKFLSRLFSSSSSSSKHQSAHGSQLSIGGNNRQGGASSGMRSASSLDNLSSYNINPKELDKNKLHKASWEGNIDKVERLARPGQINVKDQNLRTPLHLAVAKGHLEIVKYLVHEGAKLDVLDKENRTPLVKAVLSGNQNPQVTYEICRTLLDGGADAFINAVDAHGKNALHYSVEFGQERLVDLFLLVRSSDPNFRDRDQMTPLHLAVKRNNVNIVRMLLSEDYQQQADPNLMNRSGQTPLHMAASTNNPEIIQALLQSNPDEPCDPTIVDSQQLTAFQIAQIKHYDECAKIIDDYQQGWTKITPRRKISGSISEQAVNHVTMDPSQRFEDDDDDDDDDISASETSQSSRSSPQQIKRPSSQFSRQTSVSTTTTKPETPRSLADLIKNNPIQPDLPKTNVTKPNNQTLSNLASNNPIEPDLTKTNISKTTNQTVSNLVNHNPIQPDEVINSKPIISQQKQPPSLFGIGPSPLQYKDTDDTSTSMSVEKSLRATNLIVGQPSSVKKNVTINSLVDTIPHPDPIASTSNSWTHDTASTHEQQHIVKAQRVDTWDSSSATQSDNDDDDTDVYHAKPVITNLVKQPTLPRLDGTAMFTTTVTRKDSIDESKSDEDSIEAAVLKHNVQKPSNGIQNIVNTQVASSYTMPKQTPIPHPQSPISDDSTWSARSETPKKESTTKGISSLIQKQPLHTQKISEVNLDDSRPLSPDLKRNSIKTSSSSDESDDNQNNKISTIVRSPLSNGVLTNLVQTNIQPTQHSESKPTGGVENLTKIIHDIKHSSATHPKQITTASPKLIGKLIVSPLLQRNDSISSNASSLIDDTVRSLAMSGAGTTNVKQQLYNENMNEKHWSSTTTTTTTDRHDFDFLTRNHSNEMIQQSTHRQIPRTSMHHEFNSLRGSMSSSTSSIQNNMERLTELKEDIKQIERKQENSLELKRQLKDMEIKKNNFEALYQKNDQLLRETESKLEKEIKEKQRLEYATKNLNAELRSIKQKLELLEEDKKLLDQRYINLKEERDNYDEKYRIHQVTTLQTANAGVLREEDIEKIKLRHREEMKLLSAENDDLHQRTRQLQSDLQLHKESLDVTIRYKIDLEKALEEKLFLQRELDRLKHEKDFIEQEKTDYKGKYDNLQDEIRVILLDRSKLEQKLTHELQEQTKQTQRSTDDSRKYKSQIEQLNLKLGDAEARLLVLQTQNEALIASKDREIKNEFETLTQRLNTIESEKFNAEQRYHNERKEITSKQQQQSLPTLQEPLVVLTSAPFNNPVQQQHQHYQHSPSSPCVKCDTLQRNYDHEREQRLQTERDNERLRDTVSRQDQEHKKLNRTFQQYQESEHVNSENSKQIRSDTERVKYELDRLRHDFDKLVLHYEPPRNLQQQQQQPQFSSETDLLRQLYEQELREKQLLMSKLINDVRPSSSPSPQPQQMLTPTKTNNNYHRPPPSSLSSSVHHDHGSNGHFNCSLCSNSRLLKERLENAIDTSLADQRIQTIRQIPILPRQTSSLLTTNTNNGVSSVDILRQRYYV
ncbi:unnamed protein product [Adineta steineri]|uniref:Uncharacterized protein n=1 Tax=Adineta steineri TaxID=433720 RepID=A0A815FHN7_9BILA|nr:unnamed protein product [Adineta steineri]